MKEMVGYSVKHGASQSTLHKVLYQREPRGVGLDRHPWGATPLTEIQIFTNTTKHR